MVPSESTDNAAENFENAESSFNISEASDVSIGLSAVQGNVSPQNTETTKTATYTDDE